ncbi:MAG: beta-galactosidase, partial [Bacteroidales bacterium]
ATTYLKRNDTSNSGVNIRENGNNVVASASGIEIAFNKKNGKLVSVKNQKGNISLNGGPVPVGLESEITGTNWSEDDEGNFVLEIISKGYPEKITWKLQKNGLLYLEASPLKGGRNIDFAGISFNYPEQKCKAVKWMGRGPYRVWKNRLKGSNMGVWEKAYNNTVTGESFNNLIYPEFKGYHGNLYWATLESTESDFTVISETPNLYFRLFTPAKPQYVAGGTYPRFPEGDISFLYEIPAIGTKFKQADQLGPKSRKGTYGGHNDDEFYPIKLWFDFR